ncbi:hypothetical protein [Nocardia sp. BMG111209]|uniref:hypothetical protein n=1 Tax=Nocardia sp. BMG111209 TaxID=1160137 RepID=UPI00035D4CD8|nr:hypothetical protein [Nocardia sp. BMG111209]
MTSEPVTVPPRGGRALGPLAIAAAGSGVGAITHPFDRAATVLVAGFTLAALVRAVRAPDRRMRPDGRIYRGLALWTTLAVALLAWEMFAWAHQPRWSVPDPAHPTMSTLLGPYLDHGPLRFAGWFAWLVIGWMLTRPRDFRAVQQHSARISRHDARRAPRWRRGE